jgi:hypothetical protein
MRVKEAVRVGKALLPVRAEWPDKITERPGRWGGVVTSYTSRRMDAWYYGPYRSWWRAWLAARFWAFITHILDPIGDEAIAWAVLDKEPKA